MTGMGRPPLWFYTTTHGPRTKESQVKIRRPGLWRFRIVLYIDKKPLGEILLLR